MTDTRRYGLVNQLDIQQILLEAQNRWLRPAEICEILRNYKKFHISPEPANTPPSGSLFLYNRKVLRYFRKDGHNWRKKKDGKTVKEAHERLKAGSVDVLHCYYAHGEQNENFQRRSYWMLEEELSHIVLVHYREVKATRTNFTRLSDSVEAIPYSQETEENRANSEIDSSISSSFQQNNYQLPSHTTDTASLCSAQASEYEDAESAYTYQPNSRLHSFVELLQPGTEKIESELTTPYYPTPFPNFHQGKISLVPGMEYLYQAQEDRGGDGNGNGPDFTLWQNGLVNSTAGIQSVPFQQSCSSTEVNMKGTVPKQENEGLRKPLNNGVGRKHEFVNLLLSQDEGQTPEDYPPHVSKWRMYQKLPSNVAYDVTKGHPEVNQTKLLDSFEPSHAYPDGQNDCPLRNELQMHLSNTEHGSLLKSDFESTLAMDGKSNYSSILNHSSLEGSLAEGLKKFDSFNRWMSKELGDVAESPQPSSSEAYWETVECESAINNSGDASQLHLDTDMLGPSISQDQLFSIIDFSPNWAYAGSETKVLITGRVLTSPQKAEECKWSCMFGEVEVPAEAVADGVLRCHAPLHKAGRLPFYISCSNRLACSEVREFEYRPNPNQDESASDFDHESSNDVLLHMRFVKLLSLGSECSTNHAQSDDEKKSNLSSKINQLMKEDASEWERTLHLTSENDFSTVKVKEQLLQQLIKEKLHVWLLQKAAKSGKGPNVLDQGGQGVLHFAAALGYDWAILPTIVAGMNVNFRDVNGWTALHWAAFCGRERTVASLISLGAAPGALTDPTPKHPSGRTPADLASASAHKGIAGYLAESSLSAHLSALNLNDKTRNDAVDISSVKAVQSVTERSSSSLLNEDGDLPYTLSMKDSLAAVCNATQAAARIHQVFRVQSFQKKQLKLHGEHKIGMSDERALSLISVKAHKPGQLDEPVHAAAIRIQNKFRGWKGRKDFLKMRQRIVKIQAHVRGHQVRKNYPKIIWSVGIVEKIILRWRRKGSGLRGFKPDATLTEGPGIRTPSSKEDDDDDDDDFLKAGRKQAEARLQKALARVNSMVRYPEARDQYRRLRNVVTEIKETKVEYDRILNDSEEAVAYADDLIDLEALLGDDDTLMCTET